jgi:hypothetical protein
MHGFLLAIRMKRLMTMKKKQLFCLQQAPMKVFIKFQQIPAYQSYINLCACVFMGCQ